MTYAPSLAGAVWARALAAADLDAADVRPSVRTLDAALAAAADVVLLGAPTWARALAAAVFELAPVADELSVFDALDAALAPVDLPVDFDTGKPSCIYLLTPDW